MDTHEIRFVFQRDIREVLDHFSRLLRVRFCFLSPEGRELQVGENKPHCRFCRLVRDRLGMAAQCEACDRRGWQRAAQSGKAVIYRCHAGMMDGCMAVRSGERIIGYMMIGQFRTADACDGSVRTYWRTREGDDALQDAFLETPQYTDEQMQDIVGVFTVLVDFIVSHRLIGLRGLESLQPLLTYMSEHPLETLSIADAARLLHCSPSSFSHTFKSVIGTSFLQYQIQMKLERADELFRSRSGITVREAAFELGFKDPYYFSRLYRKHRGIPPSHAIKRLQGVG